MKLLTKHTDYAVRALIELAIHEGEYLSARAISQRQNIPYQFLRTILQELIRQGLVESKEGSAGGVKMIKDPKDIGIVDVINIFQGEIELSDCLFQKKLCGNRPTCVLRKEIKRIEAMVVNEFKEITIQGLMDKMSS